MNLGWWNVRGFPKALKHKEVNSFLKINNISVFAVLETKLEEGRLFDILRRQFSDWKSLYNFGSSLIQPWLVLGDFNDDLNTDDRRGLTNVSSYEVRYFMDCCVHLGLVVVNYTGSHFT
ncbi:hypothetical protein M9H77_12289 [Catharanthus roseus]|uniref:Uncharacterized protein n=1 Tax=Catharanthus roseus TaxID=4058 RepID=A0ACC0BH24_CATRO|nr:hypothetical protein M9H77_12289 [Catharanthus roseus]